MKLVLSTPQQTLTFDPVSDVTLQTPKGESMILPGHTRFLGLVSPGILTCRAAGSATSVFEVGEGFLEIFDDSLTVLVDKAVEYRSQSGSVLH